MHREHASQVEPRRHRPADTTRRAGRARNGTIRTRHTSHTGHALLTGLTLRTRRTLRPNRPSASATRNQVANRVDQHLRGRACLTERVTGDINLTCVRTSGWHTHLYRVRHHITRNKVERRRRRCTRRVTRTNRQEPSRGVC